MKLRKLILNIASILMFLAVIRYLGFKGMLGMAIGMFCMAWLLLSKNYIVRFLIDWFEADTYIDLVGDKNKKLLPDEKKKS